MNEKTLKLPTGAKVYMVRYDAKNNDKEQHFAYIFATTTAAAAAAADEFLPDGYQVYELRCELSYAAVLASDMCEHQWIGTLDQPGQGSFCSKCGGHSK